MSYNTTSIPSTVGSWALMMAHTMDKNGVNSRAIFSGQGIELESLRQNKARIINAKLNDVWQRWLSLSLDPYIALKLAEDVKPGALNTLGMSLDVSQHVYDALKRFVRFSKYLNDGADASLTETENEVSLIMCAQQSESLRLNSLNIEATFGTLYTLLNAISPKPLKVKAVYFEHEFQHDKTPFEDFFQCPAFFSSDRNQMVFEKDEIFDEYAFANSILTSTLDDWIEDYLSSYSEELVSTRIQKYVLKKQALDNIDQQNVAAHLNLSPRMLQRKLKEECISYTKLLDSCRQKLAYKFISDDKISLSELTSILGFTDQSNFSRAFKRWSGSTPYQYRNNKV